MKYAPHIGFGMVAFVLALTGYFEYQLFSLTHMVCHGTIAINEDATAISQILPDTQPRGAKHGKEP